MRRVAAFLVLFCLMLAAWESLRGSPFERFVVDDATVGVAAVVLRAIDPGLPVRAVGPKLAAPGGGLNVRAGCEGVDVLLLLLAAMAVAPMPWRARVAGTVVGTLVMFVFNQARIVGLFHAYRSDRELFGLLHGTIGPLVLVIVACAFFAGWQARFGRAPATA